MTNTSGVYTPSADTSLHLNLASGSASSVQLTSSQDAARSKQTSSFRPSKDFFLCKDDGMIGRHGNPQEIHLDHQDGQRYVLWVEQRAPTEFGLIPIRADSEPREYSNRFLGVDENGRLIFSDEWGPRQRWSITQI